MKTIAFDKSSIFLILIIASMAAVGVAAWLHFQVDSLEMALKSDSVVKVLFILEDQGLPISSYALAFYPVTRRAALFDIPPDTGLIIKSLGRTDAISALYQAKDQRPYRDEVSRLMAMDIELQLSMDLEGLSRIVDLLDGIEMFIPNPVELLDQDPPVLFPQGNTVLDGTKVASFVSYRDPLEGSSDLVSRRQRQFLSLLKRIAERSAYLSERSVFSAFRREVKTNMDSAGLRRLISILGDLDAERMVLPRLQGLYSSPAGEDRLLLFPLENGELFRSIVKQNLNALVNESGAGIGERVFSLEVLNATDVRGLAKRAANLYESFGYEVLSIENADSQGLESTIVYDRISNQEVAKNVATVIQCDNIVQGSPEETADDSTVDFSIVLGKDFNGRYCVP